MTVSGFLAPLFYVSPGQINFQLPWQYPGLTDGQFTGVVVTTVAGSSELFPLNLEGGEGLFTMDASGCGPGAVLNVGPDGGLTVNSPSNSASPGSYISIYGTGQAYVNRPPPDGTPALSNPLSTTSLWHGVFLDFTIVASPQGSYWAGLAPGLIGVDQFNIRLPSDAREGCAVPLQVATFFGISQPVTIAIHKGGGQCVDPPPAAYGQITWQKTITTNPPGGGPPTESDTFTAAFQSSPGKQVPVTVYRENTGLANHYDFFGPSCPVPSYRSLDAGSVAIQGLGLGATQTAVAALQEGAVSGLKVYRADLPAGTVKPGTLKASATGGADVSAFESSVQIGPEINITTPLAGMKISTQAPFTINWTGGDERAWVTVRLVKHFGYQDQSTFVSVNASDGALTIYPDYFGLGFDIGFGPIEIIVEVSPDPSQIPTFSAPGLTLGGQHTWKYTYRFEGATLQ